SCAFLRGYAGIRQITRRAQEGRDALCAPEDPPSIRAHASAWALRRARRIPPRRHRAELENAGKAYLAVEAPGACRLRGMKGCRVQSVLTVGRQSHGCDRK